MAVGIKRPYITEGNGLPTTAPYVGFLYLNLTTNILYRATNKVGGFTPVATVFSGTTVTTVAPYVGALFWDTDDKKLYVALDTTNPSTWVMVGVSAQAGNPATAPYIGYLNYNTTDKKLYRAVTTSTWEVVGLNTGSSNPASAPYIGYLNYNTTDNKLYRAVNTSGTWDVIGANAGSSNPATAPFIGYLNWNTGDNKLYRAVTTSNSWEVIGSNAGAANPSTAPFIGSLFFNTTDNKVYRATSTAGAWEVAGQNAGTANPSTAPFIGFMFFNTTDNKLYRATSTVGAWELVTPNAGTSLPASAPFIGQLFFHTTQAQLYSAANTAGSWTPVPHAVTPGTSLPASAAVIGQLFTNTNTEILYTARTTGGSWGVVNDNLKIATVNPVVNGSCQVWQRGTSFTYTTAQSGAKTADKWKVDIVGGSGYTMNISRQDTALADLSATPFIPSTLLRFNRSVAGTTTTSVYLYNPVQDVKLFAGQTVTLSFFIKAAVTTAMSIVSYQNFGTGGSSLVVNLNQAFNATTSWQRLSYTFTQASISGKTIGTDHSNVIRFDFPNTGTYTVDITGVQFEPSPVVTAYKQISFAEEYNRALFYFIKSFAYATAPASNLGTGSQAGVHENPQVVGASTAVGFGKVYLPTAMYKIPTITFYNPNAAGSEMWNNPAAASCSATTASRISETAFGVSATTAAGSAVGQNNVVHWTAEADL